MSAMPLARWARARETWWLTAAIGVGIFARIALAVGHRNFATGDQVEYSQLATSLADNLRYQVLLGSDPYHWAPGAPFAFAVGLRVFGRGDSGLAGAYFVEALISIAYIAVAYLVARRLLGHRAGLWCALGVAVSPGALTAGGDLITEPLGGALLLAALGILCIVVAAPAPDERRSMLLAATGGGVFGMAVLTRPDYLVLVPTVLTVLIVGWPTALRRRLTVAALVLCSCALVVAPYSLHATHKAGRLVLPTTSGASSFFVGTYLPGDGQTYRTRELLAQEVHMLFPDTQLRSHPRAIDMMRAVAARRPRLSRSAAVSAAVRANLRDYALGHPFAFTRMQIRKLGRMWQRPYAGHDRNRTWWGKVLHIPTLIAALATVAGSLYLRRRHPALLLLASVLVVGTLFNSLAAVQPRANTRFIGIAVVGAALTVAAVREQRRSPT
jgi:hypothetical protein